MASERIGRRKSTHNSVGNGSADEESAIGMTTLNGSERETTPGHDGETTTQADRDRSQSHRHLNFELAGHHVDLYDLSVQRFWDRFRGRGRRRVSWKESGKNIVFASWLNILFVLFPFAWASHFKEWHPVLTFALCFLSIIPLEKSFEFGGDQMALYCGKDIGDLIIVTLNNAVEAVLAILLLVKCELKLLQSTIVGVVLLHLLLIPGITFLIEGARIQEQSLNPHQTELNQTLLSIGVLALLLPSAFFSALDRGSSGSTSNLVTDTFRADFLKMSRGMAIILLVIYIASRVYLYNPPGEANALQPTPDAPTQLKHEEAHLAHEDPAVNPWACLILLVATIAIMAVTAEFLVQSIEFVRDQANIQQEWFGLILLPLVSWSADGAIEIAYFTRYSLRVFFGTPSPPESLADGIAIDLSIQFVLWWMPFLVLLGWWTDKPLTLLFDYFEVALLLGACFLVNYVTADAKTNWVEGLILVSFYVMIALVSWFYTGAQEIDDMLSCSSIVSGSAVG